MNADDADVHSAALCRRSTVSAGLRQDCIATAGCYATQMTPIKPIESALICANLRPQYSYEI